MAAVNSATSVRKMSNALAAHPVVSGILALVSSHREVLEFNCLPRGKVGEAWQLEDSAFLLDFLLEACSDKALKRRTFGALRAMERSSARRIQTWWRGKAHCPPEVPQCASRFEVRSEEISDPFPEVKESSEASSQPRVQILILDTPSPEVYTDMPAVRLDLAEDKPAAVDAAEPPMQRPLANQVNTELHAEVPAQETPEDALEAPANFEIEALAETEMKPEEEGSEQERLQALWLQLQQGQREWQQRQAGNVGPFMAVLSSSLVPGATTCHARAALLAWSMHSSICGVRYEKTRDDTMQGHIGRISARSQPLSQMRQSCETADDVVDELPTLLTRQSRPCTPPPQSRRVFVVEGYGANLMRTLLRKQGWRERLTAPLDVVCSPPQLFWGGSTTGRKLFKEEATPIAPVLSY
eukprot:s3634_g3.t1